MLVQCVISETLKLVAYTLFPYTCVACGRKVHSNAELCAECWCRIDFVTRPVCDRCGVMIPCVGMYCVKCLNVDCSQPFEKKRAFALYTSPAKEILTKIKHSWCPGSFTLLSKWAYTCASDLWHDVDVIVPVPSHWLRILQRGYNPAKIIAHGVAKLAGIRMLEVLRCRITPKQQGKTSKERLQNVKGKFYVVDVDCITGSRVALIDDVTTTGATLHHASVALKKAGAASIICVTSLTTKA